MQRRKTSMNVNFKSLSQTQLIRPQKILVSPKRKHLLLVQSHRQTYHTISCQPSVETVTDRGQFRELCEYAQNNETVAKVCLFVNYALMPKRLKGLYKFWYRDGWDPILYNT